MRNAGNFWLIAVGYDRKILGYIVKKAEKSTQTVLTSAVTVSKCGHIYLVYTLSAWLYLSVHILAKYWLFLFMATVAMFLLEWTYLPAII